MGCRIALRNDGALQRCIALALRFGLLPGFSQQLFLQQFRRLGLTRKLDIGGGAFVKRSGVGNLGAFAFARCIGGGQFCLLTAYLRCLSTRVGFSAGKCLGLEQLFCLFTRPLRCRKFRAALLLRSHMRTLDRFC